MSGLLNRPGIRQLGYLSEEELFEAYANAAVFCYPSIEEGFGLPLLEAMQAGSPVLASNISCLPEIAGDAAELVDPFSVGDMAAAIRKILSYSPAEREKVIVSGKERAGQFSWKKAATAYLALYRDLMG